MPTDNSSAEPSRERRDPSVAKGLLLGTGVTLVALALSALLHPYLDTHAALPPVAAVLIAVWYGGLAGGLTATTLAVVGLHLIFLDKGRDTATVTLADLLQALFFTAIAVAASVAGNSLRRMDRRLALRHREVEDLHLEVRASQAAHATEAQRFRLLVEEVRDYAVCMLDAEGKVLSWGPGAERLLGWREEEIVGRAIETIDPSGVPGGGEAAEGGGARELLRRARRHGRAESEGWSLRRVRI
jgi:two-component system sensor kinase FixL